jgi:hypothetical protein
MTVATKKIVAKAGTADAGSMRPTDYKRQTHGEDAHGRCS